MYLVLVESLVPLIFLPIETVHCFSGDTRMNLPGRLIRS